MHSLPIYFSHAPQVFTHIQNQCPATNPPIGLYFCRRGFVSTDSIHSCLRYGRRAITLVEK